jgi:probable HAF family extracellular repeat protein
MHRGILARTGLALFAAAISAAAHAASFMPLGALPDGNPFSLANGVSADGRVVVGYGEGLNRQPEYVPFRWTSSGGMVGLGIMAPGDYALARGLSGDGNVVVGDIGIALNTRAYRWTVDTGMVGLEGDLPDAAGNYHSVALDASADGSIVVGKSNNQAFRWTSGTGLVGLGSIAGAPFVQSSARAVSADGSTIVGSSYSATGDEAFRWTSSGGMVGLGYLPGTNDFGSTATDVSADGSVVVGVALNSNRVNEAFRWTSSTGLRSLGFPTNSNHSQAYGVSADGSVVVGWAGGPIGAHAVVWSEATGMQWLLDVLLAGGATGLDGWNLVSATGISADGQWVVGSGVGPSGRFEAFLANITPVPVPSVAWLFGVALGLLGWVSANVQRLRPARRQCG